MSAVLDSCFVYCSSQQTLVHRLAVAKSGVKPHSHHCSVIPTAAQTNMMRNKGKLMMQIRRRGRLVLLACVAISMTTYAVLCAWPSLWQHVSESDVLSSLPSATISTRKIYNKELVIWNSDHHPAPATDVRDLVEPFGVKFLQTDLSTGYCGHFNLCDERRKNIRVINSESMFHLDHALIPQFYAAYYNDPEMQSVNAFLCIDPPSICELYEPFNKPMIIVFTNRYYVGRQTKESWARWNANLLRYASDPRTFIAANNLYDANFVRYFTGIEPTLLPSYAGYTRTNYSYDGTRPEFLLAKRRADPQFLDEFLRDFDAELDSVTAGRSSRRGVELDRRTPRLAKVTDLYPQGYTYGDLASHPGIVHIPYQISTMSIFEQYRMNIPLFFPSKSLLLHWAVERKVLTERAFSPMDISPRVHESQAAVPHPLDTGLHATDYWIDFADFYHLPFITYFDSVDHLVDILNHVTDSLLSEISRNMTEYNTGAKEEIVGQWKAVMSNVTKYSTKRYHARLLNF